MKILTSNHIRGIDSYTIKNEPIASIDLMERAASKCFDIFKRLAKKGTPIKVFCGMGNNGGDGLAVARMLAGIGRKVSVFKLNHAEKPSEDFAINETRLKKFRKLPYSVISGTNDFPAIEKDDFVIDALFGSGLNRPLEGLPAELVRHINNSGVFVISIDIPSGLFCNDNRPNNSECIIKANHTLTFQMPKLSFFFAENQQFVGSWEVLDIGLHPQAIIEAETNFFLVEIAMLQSFCKPRPRFGHKGHFGHALLIAGSQGKGGAAILSAHAALRAGAGLLTAHLPSQLVNVLHCAVPEAMAIADFDDQIITSLGDVVPYNAVAIGPGIGTHKQTANALKLLLQNYSKPIVIDADGINILSENPTWMAFLPPGSILTPHPGEFDRLAGKQQSSYDRLESAREISFKSKVYIVLKGAYTSIVCPDGKVFFNPTGNPGMATAGSGDVLTGLILGWLAQGYTPLQSAMAAVYIHGLAGDIAANKQGQQGLIASDIIFHMGKAAKMIFGA